MNDSTQSKARPAPPYVGRFAPSPSGPLHSGSLVAAMASYLDAKAQKGAWLVRIEDIDEARTVPGSAESILHALSAFGMQWDGEVVWQSRRKALYQSAFDALENFVYPCGCSRKEIEDSQLTLAATGMETGIDIGAAVYPGTCRDGLAPGKHPRAYRIRVPEPSDPNQVIAFHDRWAGRQVQSLAMSVGDFVLKRADGFWAYQLAVVVDDADQAVTHVVRGTDLLDSTARQIYLQRRLNLPTPTYLHVPVVVNAEGEKLSKQTGASALDLTQALPALQQAAIFLGLPEFRAESLDDFWMKAIPAWAAGFS